LADILEVDVTKGLPLKESVAADIASTTALQVARDRARSVLASLAPQLEGAPWYHGEWLDDVLRQVRRRFDDACGRWRDLYRAAYEQARIQAEIRLDQSRKQDHAQADRLRREAESQLDLLTASSSAVQSDFYSYRYFA